MVLQWLDKSVLTAAPMAYADKLKLHMTMIMTPNTDLKWSAKPPQTHKTWQVDMAFNEETFPLLTQPTQATQQSSGDRNAKSPPPTPTISTASTPTHDYKAELNCISDEIKTKLTKHFESIFTQMEAKLDTWMKQQDEQQAKQEKIKAQVAKQLGFLVDNMKKFLKYATPVPQQTPLPHSKGRL